MTDAALHRLMTILKTALPFLLPPMNSAVELMVKLLDTICTFKNFKTREQHQTDDSDPNRSVDMEGLLHAVSSIVNDEERAMIERIGNMLHAMSFFKQYSTLFSNAENSDEQLSQLLKGMTGNENLNLDMMKAFASMMMNTEQDSPDETAKAPRESHSEEVHSDSSYDEMMRELEAKLSPEERALYEDFKTIF